MSEGQQFFLILCLLCLSESVLWVKPQAWVFLSGWPGGRWKADLPARHGGRGRFVLCQPLPPLGWGFVCGERGAGGSPSVAGAREKVRAFFEATRRLRFLAAWVAFPWFFVLVPLTYWLIGPEPLFWIVLALGWVALAATAVSFHRVHRRLYPAKSEERWQHTILAALVPQHAIRVPGVLARPWLVEFTPLAVGAATLPPEVFAALAGKECRRWAFPLPATSAAADAAAMLHFPAGKGVPREIEAILNEAGLSLAALLLPPERQGEAQAYCPRCLAQFDDPGARCADCAGLEVARWPVLEGGAN